MARFELPEWAKRKVGPFPVWVYGAVGGGVLIALYLRGHPFGAGSAPRAQIGAPAAGAGPGTGNLPRSQPALETSPPGSPQPPGRVSSITSPSRFISSFNPQRGYTNPGPIPNVGGHILGTGGVSLPELMEGGALQLSGVGPESVAGFAQYRAGERQSEDPLMGITALSGVGPTAELGFSSYRAGEREDLNYAPAGGFGPSLFDQALGPAAVGGYSAGAAATPQSSYSNPGGSSAALSSAAYSQPDTASYSPQVSYSYSPAIQSDIAQSTPDYSVSGATASAPGVGDVGPTSGGAGTSSVF